MGLLHQCQRNDGASDLVARPIASFAHDGTERRIVRPQNPAEQTECYSGKKKDHTVKNILLVNALLIILFLSDTVGSMTSGLPNRTPYRPGADCCRISASWPSRSPRWRSSCRRRNHQARNCHRRSKEPTHSRRLRIEHVNSSVKRCRVVKDRIRLWKQGVRDVVMEICCALHNFRVRLTPWQPMV